MHLSIHNASVALQQILVPSQKPEDTDNRTSLQNCGMRIWRSSASWASWPQAGSPSPTTSRDPLMRKARDWTWMPRHIKHTHYHWPIVPCLTAVQPVMGENPLQLSVNRGFQLPIKTQWHKSFNSLFLPSYWQLLNIMVAAEPDSKLLHSDVICLFLRLQYKKKNEGPSHLLSPP